MKHGMLFLYTESPVHAGGAGSTGFVDLPIQREVTTGLPIIWGQSLKGAIREKAFDQWKDPAKVADVFGDRVASEGQSPDDGTLRPGRVSVGDARVAAFPVPSTRNTFAWISSPLVVDRLARSFTLADLPPPAGPPQPGAKSAYAAGRKWAGRVALGEEILNTSHDNAVEALAKSLGRYGLPDPHLGWVRSKFSEDFLVVEDEVLQTATMSFVEILHRIQLKEDTKNVNNLFVEEFLPAETLLAAQITCFEDGVLDDVKALLDGKAMRIGGDETVGKGLVWCSFITPDRENGHG